MKFSPVILAVILASSTSLTALAEASPASSNSSAVTAAGGPLAAADAQVIDPKNQRTASTDPPVTSRSGSVTGSVLGVDPRARIITVRVDHSVGGIHTGDQIHMDKTAILHKKTRRHRPIHRKTRNAPTRSAPPRQAPPSAPPASSTPSAANAPSPHSGSRPVEENSGTGTATLPPASPPPAAPPSASTPSDSTAPSASEIPPELGLVPRRSGGYVSGSTAPGGL